jgi:hypothetical protein
MKMFSLFLTFILGLSILMQPLQACDSFLKKGYPEECKIQDRYNKLKAGFDKHGVDIDFLTEFRAIRFIARRDMVRTIKENKSGFLTWDIYAPKPKTWLKWEEGNFHRSIVSAEMKCLSDKGKGWKFSTSSLAKLHLKTIGGGLAGPMEKIPLLADFFPKPGEIRHGKHFNSGFMIKKWMGGPLTKEEYKLVKNFEIMDKSGKPLVRTTLVFRQPDLKKYIGRIKGKTKLGKYLAGKFKGGKLGQYLTKKFKGGAVGQVGYLRSKQVPYEMTRLFKHINEALRFYKAGKKTSGDPDYNDFNYKRTPLQLVADLQRRYIAIHPFHEGNGRMSRFIQDMLLQLFKLPPSPAGDLQSDVLTTNSVYRKETVNAFELAMNNLESCLKQYDKGGKVEPRCTHMYEAHKSESDKIKAGKKKFYALYKKSINDIKKTEKPTCISKDDLNNL